MAQYEFTTNVLAVSDADDETAARELADQINQAIIALEIPRALDSIEGVSHVEIEPTEYLATG